MIPKWLEKRHEILWEAFQNSPFRFEDAASRSKKTKSFGRSLCGLKRSLVRLIRR